MRNNFVLILVISSLIATINCSLIRQRTKRNPDGFLDTIKTGLIEFGVNTKNVFDKGYEETKNLFSSERKVGDYRINEFNVRTGFGSIVSSQETEGQQIETATNRTKRELKEEEKDEEKIDELPDDHNEEEQNKSEETQAKDMPSYNRPAIYGSPPLGFIFLVPLSCKANEVLVRGSCRPLA